MPPPLKPAEEKKKRAFRKDAKVSRRLWEHERMAGSWKRPPRPPSLSARTVESPLLYFHTATRTAPCRLLSWQSACGRNGPPALLPVLREFWCLEPTSSNLGVPTPSPAPREREPDRRLTPGSPLPRTTPPVLSRFLCCSHSAPSPRATPWGGTTTPVPSATTLTNP